jgi:hypothetical protein
MLIDGVEFDSTFSRRAKLMQEAGVSPAQIRKMLEIVGPDSASGSDGQTDDDDDDDYGTHDNKFPDGDDSGNYYDHEYDNYEYSDDDCSGGLSSASDYEYGVDWFQLLRQDMIHILRGMKINVTLDTKLDESLLEAGLRDAFKSAQSNVKFPLMFDPDTLPLWNHEKSIAEAFKLPLRGLPMEEEFADMREGAAQRVYEKLLAFVELMEKDGIDCVRFVDQERLRAFGVRV